MAALCGSGCTRSGATSITVRMNPCRSRCNTVRLTRHWQGVQTLGPGLRAEARATDGVIEAFRVAAASGFALGVQWHPEWQFKNNVFSRALFAAFGAACRARFATR